MSPRAKTMLSIGALALGVRLLTLAWVFPNLRSDVDRDDYRQLAGNLIAGRGFVSADATGQPRPNLARTPVYPIFLAATGNHLPGILLAQCVLAAGTAALTVMLAAQALPVRYAGLAGGLVALDLNSILRTCDVLTEILFAGLLVAGLCLLAMPRERPSRWGWAGLLLGLAALCRPIAVGLWVIVLFVVPTWRWRAIFLAGFLLVVLGWAARNYGVTGHWFVSTIADYNLLLYRATGIIATKTGQPLPTVQRDYLERHGNLQYFHDRATFDQSRAAYRRVSYDVVSASVPLALQQMVTGWFKVMFGPGAQALHNIQREPQSLPAPVQIAYVGLLATGWALTAVALVLDGRRWWWLGLMTGYFIVLAGGPEANSRFRTVITPAWAVLTAAGAAAIAARKEKL
jgi:4-amino-4-deoxy-L-arabinose transferase-like glycosyltransferase